MGLGGISIWQLLIILAIVLLIFGTKRLKNIGGDMGGAIKGFKDAMGKDEAEQEEEPKQVEETDEAKAHAKESTEQTTSDKAS